MPILENQYEELNDPKQRVEFRAELLKLTDYQRKSLLKNQSLSSLIKLRSSVNGVLQQDISAEARRDFDKLLSDTNFALDKKQKDVPVAYDTILHNLGDVKSSAKRSFQINSEEGEPYFTLSFPSVLNAVIKRVLGSSEYSDEELMLHARRSDSMHISKAAIQGQESSVGNKIEQAILDQKLEIIALLRSKVLEQQQRCQSDSTRQNDQKLQTLSNQASRKLQELDTIVRDAHVGVAGILSVIDSTSVFVNAVDIAVVQLKQSVSSKTAQNVFRERLHDIVNESSPHTQKPQHEYSQYEISNLLTIAPRESESFVTLHVNSELKIINEIIKEVYGACESRDPKTFVMARRGNMMFIDKTLLQENRSLNQQKVKEKFVSHKDQLVAELKEAITFSMDRCASDEKRQSSPELTQLKQQGESKLAKLDKLNSAEELIQAIEETENYKQNVSDGIKIFKEASSSARFGR